MTAYRRRTDANHADIVAALRKTGWIVWDTHHYPEFVDAIAMKAGRLKFIEIKDGSKPPSARRLTLAQEHLHGWLQWAEHPVVVLASVEEALNL